MKKYKIAALTNFMINELCNTLNNKFVSVSIRDNRAPRSKGGNVLIKIDGHTAMVWVENFTLIESFRESSYEETFFSDFMGAINDIPEPKEKFLSYPVDSSGFFMVGEHRMPWRKAGIFDIKNSNGNALIFAGWVYRNKYRPQDDPTISTDLLGYNPSGSLIRTAQNWAEPATPTHVRFWEEQINESD